MLERRPNRCGRRLRMGWCRFVTAFWEEVWNAHEADDVDRFVADDVVIEAGVDGVVVDYCVGNPNTNTSLKSKESTSASAPDSELVRPNGDPTEPADARRGIALDGRRRGRLTSTNCWDK